MEELKNYLESSTVHGFIYISTTRRLVKIFWITVIITGFTTAGYLIKQSFKEWEDNPVTTTIETRPISEVRFPLITVCPPSGTYTNLNHDLEKSKNIEIDLKEYSIQLREDFKKKKSKKGDIGQKGR